MILNVHSHFSIKMMVINHTNDNITTYTIASSCNTIYWGPCCVFGQRCAYCRAVVKIIFSQIETGSVKITFLLRPWCNWILNWFNLINDIKISPTYSPSEVQTTNYKNNCRLLSMNLIQRCFPTISIIS